MVGLALSEQVSAIEYNYSVFSSLRYSDNIAQRAGGGEISGTELDLGVRFEATSDQNSSLEYELSGMLGLEEYSEDELESQETKQLSASITYTPPRSNFNVLLRDDLSQVPRNRFSSQEVGNIAETNVLTFRPEYTFRISAIDSLITDVTYVDTTNDSDQSADAQTQLFDSAVTSFSARYEHRINATNDLSIIYDEDETEYDKIPGTNAVDFDQENIFLRWVNRGRLNQIQLEYGEAKIQDELGGEFDTDLSRVFFGRQINRTHRIELNVRKGFFVNIAENFANDTLDTNDQSSNFSAAQLFENRSANYVITGEFLNLNFNWFDSSFESTRDSSFEEQKGVELTASYSLNRILQSPFDSSISLSLRQSENIFNTSSNELFENNVESISISYSYTYNQDLSFLVELSSRNADEIVVNSPFIQSDANSISIGMRYTPTSNTSQNRANN